MAATVTVDYQTLVNALPHQCAAVMMNFSDGKDGTTLPLPFPIPMKNFPQGKPNEKNLVLHMKLAEDHGFLFGVCTAIFIVSKAQHDQ